MASGDWVALGSAIVAAVALVVSGLAYRQQRVTQRRTDEQQLNDLIEKLEKGLADVSRPQGTMAFETYATENAAKLTSLLGQAVQAKELIDRSGIRPDWFQSMVLAYAFSEAWDLPGAIDYWKRAVEISKPEQQEADREPDHQPYIRSLAARAEFYYNRGLKNGTDGGEGDWTMARDDYDAALKLLLADPDKQGPDLSRQQAASLLVYQAGLELNMVGDDAKGVGLIGEAFTQADKIAVEWRRLTTLQNLGDCVVMFQGKLIRKRDLITPVAEELKRRQVDVARLPARVANLLSHPPGSNLDQPTSQYGATA
jgi:tetratricopeptide (TPR) repeat protein